MKFYLNCGWKQFQSVNDLRSYAMLVGAAAKKRPENSGLGPVSQKSRKLFGPEKPFLKLRPAYSVKLVFWYVVKGTKIKITAIFRVSERLHFELIKRLLSPEKFRDFRETGPWTGLEPRPQRCRCSAQPVELSGKLGAGHFAGISSSSFICHCKRKELNYSWR